MPRGDGSFWKVHSGSATSEKQPGVALEATSLLVTNFYICSLLPESFSPQAEQLQEIPLGGGEWVLLSPATLL